MAELKAFIDADFAKKYDEYEARFHSYALLGHHLMSVADVQKGHTVLEIGGGTGNATMAMLRSPLGILISTEPSKEMQTLAKAKFGIEPGMEELIDSADEPLKSYYRQFRLEADFLLRQNKLESYNLAADKIGTFQTDRIIGAAVYYWMHKEGKIQESLEAIRKSLKPNGLFVFNTFVAFCKMDTEYNYDMPYTIHPIRTAFYKEMQRIHEEKYGLTEKVQIHSDDRIDKTKIRSDIEDNGFSVIREEELPMYWSSEMHKASVLVCGDLIWYNHAPDYIQAISREEKYENIKEAYRNAEEKHSGYRTVGANELNGIFVAKRK